MTRLEALTDLRDKVKVGSIARHDLDAFIPVFGLTTQGNDAHSAYKGSLDAAKALHEAVLPGWRVGKLEQQKNEWAAVVSIFNGRRLYGVGGNICPARAWLIAILEALIAQETDQ